MSGTRYLIKCLLALCAAFLMFSSSAIARDPVISTWHIPFYLEDENNGSFIEMIREIENRIQHKFEIQILPAKRSISYFKKGMTSVLFPAMQPNIPEGMKVVRSVPFMKKAIYAFVLKGDPIPTSFEDLFGKKVGLVRGYAYPDEVTNDKRIEVQYATMAAQSMKKLQVGWADVVLDDIVVGKDAINKTQALNIVFNANAPFALVDVFFAFHPTPEGELLAQKISNVLIQMQVEGNMTRFISRP
ncbi:MAG: amino acid ABC transporter substrate-binding protein [Desulfobacteraceae bacterium]|nr:amino acid ABC transporter substrate-binding protein [Desulfobacteraceae bacterium]